MKKIDTKELEDDFFNWARETLSRSRELLERYEHEGAPNYKLQYVAVLRDVENTLAAVFYYDSLATARYPESRKQREKNEPERSEGADVW